MHYLIIKALLALVFEEATEMDKIIPKYSCKKNIMSKKIDSFQTPYLTHDFILQMYRQGLL